MTTKYNANVVSTDMKGRLEFMMNIYNHLMMSDQDILPNKPSSDRPLNGYMKLMRCAVNSKKLKKSNKKSCFTTANKPINIRSAVQKNYKDYNSR